MCFYLSYEGRASFQFCTTVVVFLTFWKIIAHEKVLLTIRITSFDFFPILFQRCCRASSTQAICNFAWRSFCFDFSLQLIVPSPLCLIGLQLCGVYSLMDSVHKAGFCSSSVLSLLPFVAIKALDCHHCGSWDLPPIVTQVSDSFDLSILYSLHVFCMVFISSRIDCLKWGIKEEGGEFQWHAGYGTEIVRKGYGNG